MIKRVFESKGGYLHQFCVYRIKERALRQGFTADVEFMLSNGKAVDLVLRREGEILFIEAATSEPMEKEVRNLVNNVTIELTPNQLIVAVKDTKMKRSLESLIAGSEELKMHLTKIRVVYAGDLIIGKGKEAL
jgi:hypothetical protein